MSSTLSKLHAAFCEYMIRGRLVVGGGIVGTEASVLPFYYRKIDGTPTNADGGCKIADNLAALCNAQSWSVLKASDPSKQLLSARTAPLKPQTIGTEFERLVRWFLQEAFINQVGFLRTDKFAIPRPSGDISKYLQYRHLVDIGSITKLVQQTMGPLSNDDMRLISRLKASSYLIRPDVVIENIPITAEKLNERWRDWRSANTVGPHDIGDEYVSASDNNGTVLLNENNNESSLLHAIISCKWTIRSDRGQNVRSEARFSTNERRGSTPHVVAVTGEPRPTRIRSIALGSEVDCVYHFDLRKLQNAVETSDNASEIEWLKILMEADRLRDLSALPLDLAL
jgi:hypothetical protein